MMELFFLPAAAALAAVLVLLWAGLLLRRRNAQRRRGAARDALDTVAAWPPQAARVLSVAERQAYDLVRRAAPNFLVLAQVPLARFIRVPLRHSYADWLQRVGSLSADLMVCDAGSRVLAVIDIRAEQESERSRRRHERMTRVLRAAGVHVFTWREGQLPQAAEVRSALARLVGPPLPATAARPATRSRPMPLATLMPVPDVAEALAEGDRNALEAAFDPHMEPVPSAFLDDVEPAR